jgi:hypothetical protein
MVNPDGVNQLSFPPKLLMLCAGSAERARGDVDQLRPGVRQQLLPQHLRLSRRQQVQLYAVSRENSQSLYAVSLPLFQILGGIYFYGFASRNRGTYD